MSTFSLHPILAADCHVLGQWRDLRVLLHRDAHARWLILVPEIDDAEWHELPAPLREQLLTASSVMGAMFRNDDGCDKVKLAAIGNMVPQFHFHVIGRWKTDASWPGVVWGRSVPGQVYEIGEVRRLQTRALACLPVCRGLK